MLGPDLFLTATASSFQLTESAGLFAYGPAPQMELIPYFLSLLTWVGLSFGAILLWPISRFFRRFRKQAAVPQATQAPEPIAEAAVSPSHDSSQDGSK